jgi:tRNA modification GTPase
MAKVSSSGLSSDLVGGDDTIVARATPAGRGALALIRVSGERARSCAARVCPELDFEPGWRASLTAVLDVRGVILDRAVVVAYPGPRSYTGEDMLEITVHGSPYLAREVIGSLVAAGARPAEPGEFTRRAVANGKLDLIQAEAIRDLVAADTAWQHHTARLQLSGALSARFAALKSTLVGALATVEASLDYEAQGVTVAGSEIAAHFDACRDGVSSLLATAAVGARIHDGLRVVIVGPPNAGKSTLFNWLCGSERAIVSPHPGTTRDLLEAALDIGGIRTVVQDTAGLRAEGDEVELEGHRRAQDALAVADLALVLWPADGAEEPPVMPATVPAIRLRSKADVDPGLTADDGWHRLSCHSGEGLENLRRQLYELALVDVPDLGGAVAIAERHRRALESAAEELARCDVEQPETSAESLRWAMRSIDRLIGEVATEDVLDEVFESFCIGK